MSIPKNYLLLGLLVIIVVALFASGKFAGLMAQPTPGGKSVTAAESGSTITGTIDIDGYVPQNATIAIGVKEIGNPDFVIAVRDLPAAIGTPWTADNLQAGITYQVQAYLQVQGKTISSSPPITATSPSEGILLEISSTAVAPVVANAVISGTFNLNGYIPPSSTITISAKKPTDTTFTTVSSGITPADASTWDMSDAIAGTQYQIQATLLDGNNNTLMQSQIQTITAPASDEIITFNSTITPPTPPTGSVSGSLQLGGSIPNGSTITVASRPTGNGTFTPFATGLAATNGTAWSLSNATSGQSYDIQATLVNNGATLAQSQTLTVPAPASGEVLTLNFSQAAAPPTGPSVQCLSKSSSNGMWSVTVTYNVVPNAQQYWIQIGNNAPNYDNIINSRYPAGQPSANRLTFTTGNVIQNATNYYVNYATATDPNTGIETNFSLFSPASAFTCQ